ncbi:MAG TPA: PUA domain-containing protein, partial [Solirubrobacteraceae bacterium]
FDAGDAVEIAVRDNSQPSNGGLIAKGICNYSAEELRRVIGMKTEAVRGILPHATDEAVHRDYLVVG